MPLVAHNALPTFDRLRRDGITVLSTERAANQEIRELHAYGVARIFSPEDGQKLGLMGMIGSMVAACDIDLAPLAPTKLDALKDRKDDLLTIDFGDAPLALARAMTEKAAKALKKLGKKARFVAIEPGVVATSGLGGVTLSPATLLALAACVAAPACYGLAGVYIKRRAAEVPSLAVAGGSLSGTCAALTAARAGIRVVIVHEDNG